MQKKGSNPQRSQETLKLRNFNSPTDRRAHLGKELGLDLSSLSNQYLENSSDVYCENLIGGISIPVGVAGPLLLNGLNESRIIPLATTEGALVASISRGCKAISESGGADVESLLVGQTRGPVFKIKNIREGLLLKKWIEKNSKRIGDSASLTSKHIQYLGSKIKIIGNNLFMRLLFDTDKAMGMNMVTVATEEITNLIENETKVKCIAVAGNFDIDKKPAWLNIVDGRGYEVWAECVIGEEVLKETLKTTAQKIYEVWISKVMVGSYASGSLGFNSHFANIISAIFIATGQDPAHIVEGSCGITICEVRDKDLFISINLPSLIIGIVGGGTKLKDQRMALKIMGIDEKSKTSEFAKIIAGALLAGELSLLSSLSTKTLGKSHLRLGRGGKV